MVSRQAADTGEMPVKPILILFLLGATLLHSASAQAQQSQDFGDFVVHYNALNSKLIPPQVAQAYGIQRSSNRGLLNVTVLKKVLDMPGSPVAAAITAGGTNLTGQHRTIEMREIRDPEGAIYYIGQFPVHNMETYRFAVQVEVEGEDEPLVVKFKQQFFTE
jgi:hypothetical protein